LASIPQVLNVSIEPVTLTASKEAVTPAVATDNNKVAKPVAPTLTAEKSEALSKSEPTPTTAPVKTVVQNASPENSSDKKSSQLQTVNIPGIDNANTEPTIELTVDKDRQVIINSVDQTSPVKKTEPTTPVATTTPLSLPNNVKTEANKEPGFFSRLGSKVSNLFHKDKKAEPTAPPATVAQATITPTQPVSANAVPEKTPVKTASNTTAAAQETAKASHTLVQTFKDNLCRKYSHFCAHPNTANTAPAAHAPLANTAFVNLQGKLHWPTVGDVATRFGTELGDSKLKYNGVLIQAPQGQPVHAIYNGRVIFANWLQGLGLLLIIDHGNGYMSLYGHNEALYKKVGDIVKPNDLIAAVGNSGAPGPTGLYFEIRHNGQPINPEQWCG